MNPTPQQSAAYVEEQMLVLLGEMRKAPPHLRRMPTELLCKLLDTVDTALRPMPLWETLAGAEGVLNPAYFAAAHEVGELRGQIEAEVQRRG